MENPEGFAEMFIHNLTSAHLSIQKWLRQHRHDVSKMSMNGASKTSGLASWTMQGLCGDMKP